MKYVVKTPASTLPVTLADVKSHLRAEDYTDHDDLITTYIEAAAKTIEQRANLMLKAQTWTLYLEQSEVSDRIKFYKWPVTSISSIKYYDSDNSLQTMDSSNYTTIITLRPTEIIIEDLPSVYDRSDAMQIEFVGGFTTVPDDIILAIKQRCFKVYNNPSDFVEMKTTYMEKVITDYRGYDE
jgi:uncharacterized phiE125 gp8 family phage protein